MMVTLNKPIYHGGSVQLAGTNIETGEQHGRTLIRKGFASAPQAEKSKEPAAPKKQEAPAKAEKPAAKK